VCEWHFVCDLMTEELREEKINGDSPNGERPQLRRNRKRKDSCRRRAVRRSIVKVLPALYRIAFRKLGNAEDAEGAQDAPLSAFRNIHQFRGDAQFSRWLGSIVLNSARMQLRLRLNHNLVSLDENRENLEEGKPI
jgi:DNA-directed RNA polymerase specialized sigma24 family protein